MPLWNLFRNSLYCMKDVQVHLQLWSKYSLEFRTKWATCVNKKFFNMFPCSVSLWCSATSFSSTFSNVRLFVIFHVRTWPSAFKTQNNPVYCFIQYVSVSLSNWAYVAYWLKGQYDHSSTMVYHQIVRFDSCNDEMQTPFARGKHASIAWT